MRRRKHGTRPFYRGDREHRSGKDRLIERKVERIGHLRSELGVAVAARDIPQRELPDLSVRVHERLGLLLEGCGLLLAPGFDAGFVVRGQDFRAVQIFVGINVLLLLRVFARSFLASGFSDILGRLGAALCGAGE
jgi:hypothetical protein